MNNTDEQEKIINSDAEHLLVIAGAGSGKTTTLIKRIQHLVDENKVSPQSILGLTFTVKASLELGKKSAEGSKNGDGAIRVQTYDSFVQEIVRQYGLLIGVNPQTSLLSDAGICQCIADVMDQNPDCINDCFNEISEENPTYTLPSLTPSTYANTDLPTAIKKFTESVLNFLIEEEHLSFDEAVKPTENWNNRWIESLRQILKDENSEEIRKNLETLLCTAKLRKLVIDLSKQYAALKEKQTLAQYGDFTVYALKLLCTFPYIAQAYRDKYKYVFLDEYQDTNHTQGILMKLLFAEGTNVTAVGDPQQAIYGFRGSAPGAFPYFEKEFDIAENDKLSLSKTFRNKKNVADLANKITEHLRNEERQDLTSNDPADAEISVFAFKDSASEGKRAVFKFVENERGKGNKKIAILGRRNKDLPPYKDFLEEQGVACTLTGNLAFDNENPIARDLKNFLSVCSDPFAAAQAEDLLTSPRYGLPLSVLRELAGEVIKANNILNNDLYGKDKHKKDPLITLPLYLADNKYELPEDAQRFRKDLQSVAKVVTQGIEEAVIAAWKALDFNSDIAVAEALLGKLPYSKLTLEDVLKAVKTYKADLQLNQTPSLKGFLEWIENYEITTGQSKSADGTVEIMTIHQAKGLEWESVAVVGMEKIQKDFNRGGFENKKRRNGRGPDTYWKGTWINSYDCVPGNKRADLKDLGKTYQEACEAFSDPEKCKTVEDLSKKIDALCEAEIRREEVEEAHTAYVSVTRSKGDLLLISEITGTTGFKCENLNKPACVGEFWTDAAKFLGGEKEWEEKELTGKDTCSFAIRSTGEQLKKAIIDELEKPQDETDDNYVWPVQIKESLRQILEQSADRVTAASSDISAGSRPGLCKKATEVLKFHRSLSQSQTKKSLPEQFKEANKGKPSSATYVQWLINKPDAAMQFAIRPMPHESAKKAQAGTEFHAWVKTQLSHASDEEQCKIKDEYKGEFSRWKDIFLNSEWNKRKLFCAEEPFTVLIPGLSAPITAKPDAVFWGGLDGDNLSAKLTIVDWKTGEIPEPGEEEKEKLLQLEIYRLTLSRALKKDIRDIDACLYYFSKGGDQLPITQPMDEEEIVKKITSIEGMRALSDEAEKEA